MVFISQADLATYLQNINSLYAVFLVKLYLIFFRKGLGLTLLFSQYTRSSVNPGDHSQAELWDLMRTTFAQPWIIFLCQSLLGFSIPNLQVKPPRSRLTFQRLFSLFQSPPGLNTISSRFSAFSWEPARFVGSAELSWQDFNEVIITRIHNICIYSPYQLPIPLPLLFFSPKSWPVANFPVHLIILQATRQRSRLWSAGTTST